MPTVSVKLFQVETALATYEATDPNLNNQVSELSDAACTSRWHQLNNVSGAADAYMKLYDTSASPSIGTTTPSMIVVARAGKRSEVVCKEGLAWAAGLQGACVLEPGTDGTTSPAVSVTGRVSYT